MAKKVVKPVKKAAKPAPKKANKPAKPVKKASKPAPKKATKPAPKKAAKPVAKATVKKVVAKKPVSKPAPKKVTKPAPKKVVKSTKPLSKPAPKKVEKKVVKPVVKATKRAPQPTKKAVKKVEVKKATKPAKELIKATSTSTATKKVGKPIDAVAKKSEKASKKVAKASKKGKTSDEDDEDFEVEEEDEEEDDDVADDYEKPEEDDTIDIDSDLDGPPVLDIEGGGIPLDDDDDDEIPEKRGRGRRKKNEGRAVSSESYIRNRPLHIDITKPLIKKQQAPQPKPFVNTKDDRSRYSDKELAEFKELILDKLKEAQTDYDLLKQTLSNADNHGTDDTSPSFKLLEDGSDVLSKEETAQLAIRQEKYILNLKNALMRIENKTYGICRVTGKLIPKERLRSVPHATLGIDAKLKQSS